MKPNVSFLVARALEAIQKSSLDSATLYLSQANKIDQKNPEILRLLGVVAAQKAMYQDAIKFFNLSLAEMPKNCLTHSNLGNVFLELMQYQTAIAHYDKAISLMPSYHEAWNNKGNALFELRYFEDAIAHYDKAISLMPSYHEAWNNKGNALFELRYFEDAIAHYDKAISLMPSYHEAWNNKGFLLQVLGHHSAALEHYDRAITLSPNYVQANWNKALLQLLLGNYEDGWKLHEWRWKTRIQRQELRLFNKPLWLGQENIENKTILIWAEQGLGDTIQFCRYVKMVADLGARVLLEVQKPLTKILSTLEGVSEIYAYGNGLPEFDFHCPLMSLPLAFKTNLNSIPKVIPYIYPEPIKVKYWKDKLSDEKNTRVGLVWSGGFRPNQPDVWSVNQKRNIPLLKLTDLAMPGITFYSLQKGELAEGELLKLKALPINNFKIIDHTEELIDYSDTAAYIANLDLVISVDTSVAHMAGALGRPTWILNRFDSDWRWQINKSQSPWYQTVSIFNQAALGDWDSVLLEVKENLTKLVQNV